MKKVDKLFAALNEDRRISVVVHDNPDPDAIASGWAIKQLLESSGEHEVRLIARGSVSRAENVQFIKLLNPPLEFLDAYNAEWGSAAVLVDCVPTGRNHMLAEASVNPIAVIDHHAATGRRFKAKFKDIRLTASATATIAASYLMEKPFVPRDILATALLYAIRSDIAGSSDKLSSLDKKVISWLSKHADHNKLKKIVNAPLSIVYFTDLICALQNTFLYDDTAYCFLPTATGAEIVGEVADLLIRIEVVRRAFCAAKIGDDIMVSARTDTAGDDAVELLEKTLASIGYFGGHNHRAGGKLHKSKVCSEQDMAPELRRRWLNACNIDSEKRGTRLIAKKTILNTL